MTATSNVLSLERAEIAQETVAGTLKAMTRPLYHVQGGLTWTHDIPMDDAKEALGTKYNTDGVEGGIPTTRINIECILAYQDVQWWLDKALFAINLGTPANLTGAYGYTFEPDGDGFDLNTFCMIAGDAAVAYAFKRCLVNRAVFRWNPQSGGEAHWRAAFEIWAQFVGTDTFESPADYARTKILAKGTDVYSDATGGTIGTTAKTKVRSGSITIDNQLEEKIYSEDTIAVSNDWGYGEQLITAELVAEFASDTDFALYRDNTRRQMRIKQEGGVAGGSNNYTLQFDFPRAHIVSFRPSRAGQNRTVAIGLVAETDRANSLDFPMEAYVINELATTTV